MYKIHTIPFAKAHNHNAQRKKHCHRWGAFGTVRLSPSAGLLVPLLESIRPNPTPHPLPIRNSPRSWGMHSRPKLMDKAGCLVYSLQSKHRSKRQLPTEPSRVTELFSHWAKLVPLVQITDSCQRLWKAFKYIHI